MKKLRIGQISPLNLPVPPKKYGGTEKIVYFLCEKLKQKGHSVYLFGTKASRVSCHLVPIIEKGLWQMEPKDCIPYYMYQMAIVARGAKKLKLDVLHDHLGPISLCLNGQIDIPLVHTLHIPFHDKDRPWAYKKLNSQLVSLSFAQRKPAPKLNYIANIYNGIDVENYPFNEKPKDYFLWVGELSQRKGILEVIEIAKKTKIRLVLAGRIPPPKQQEDHLFFKKHIEKRLNKDKIEYVGEKTPEALKGYYKNAKAFLFPLQWEEPFGLTMVEAMSCGTPVIAFRRGSVPEIIENGKTGFVVSPFLKGKTNIDGFARAVGNIGSISRKNCRKSAEEKFSLEKMAERYEKLFFRLTK